MIDSLIKSIMEQIGLLVERRAPEELLKTLPNGQWELLRKAAPLNQSAENPHSQSNAMMSYLFHQADIVHKKLQPHIDKHVQQFRSAPMKQVEWNRNLKYKETSFKHLYDHRVDVPVHPALQVWGDQLEENTGKRPDFNTIQGVRGALKQYLLDMPRGQIDLAHLNKLREGSRKIPVQISDRDASRAGNEFVVQPGAQTERMGSQRILSTDDMAEIINHHVGDAKSLKDIHDKNGGIGAIEALGRTMGANAGVPMYSNLNLHPQVHVDLQDLMRPGSHVTPSETPEYAAYQVAHLAAVRDARRRNPTAPPEEHYRMADENVPPFEGDMYAPELDSTYNHSADVRNNEAVDRSFQEAMYGPGPDGVGSGGDPVALKNHENAVIDRALAHFKRHHKLK